MYIPIQVKAKHNGHEFPVVQAGNVIPARANIKQAKPRTNKEKSSFPHLRRITHLYDEEMQPPTNRKNGAHNMNTLLKEFICLIWFCRRRRQRAETASK